MDQPKIDHLKGVAQSLLNEWLGAHPGYTGEVVVQDTMLEAQSDGEPVERTDGPFIGFRLFNGSGDATDTFVRLTDNLETGLLRSLLQANHDVFPAWKRRQEQVQEEQP